MNEANKKELLVTTIKEWITINNKLTQLQKSMKELRVSKKQLSDTLISVMENNEIDRFDINNGKLVYRKSKVKSAINKDYLLKMLENYFKEYPEVDTNDVGSFILDNRPIKENQTLVIRQNK
tara:strand:- start:1497 stop:1862 length:366 start_codon:yes stop_codon:yes gene_type:complete